MLQGSRLAKCLYLTLSICSSSKKEAIVILIGGLSKVRDGLFLRKEPCQYFGIKLDKSINSVPLRSLLICLGTGQPRSITFKPELFANGNQLSLVPTSDFQLRMNTIQLEEH